MYHPTTQRIVNILKNAGVWFETFEHEEVRTSEEAAKVRTGYELQQGAKALIVRFKKEGIPAFAMIVVPGDEKFNGKRARTVLGAKDVSFATPEEVAECTGGIKIGGVPPFGNLFGIPVYADSHLFDNEKIIFNAGDRGFSVAMRSEDYRALVSPVVETLCE